MNSDTAVRQEGFSYIELILYVAIVGIVLTTITHFALQVIGGSVKSTAEQEVAAQARFISERIKYEIRNATDITGVDATSLTLSVPMAANSPTIIALSGNKITIKLGTAAAVNLNSNQTAITALTFTDYRSLDNKSKNVQFSFTIDDAYGSVRQEYRVPSLLVQGSAELRSN